VALSKCLPSRLHIGHIGLLGHISKTLPLRTNGNIRAMTEAAAESTQKQQALVYLLALSKDDLASTCYEVAKARDDWEQHASDLERTLAAILSTTVPYATLARVLGRSKRPEVQDAARACQIMADKAAGVEDDKPWVKGEAGVSENDAPATLATWEDDGGSSLAEVVSG
jgi:hypothetical protein